MFVLSVASFHHGSAQQINILENSLSFPPSSVTPIASMSFTAPMATSLSSAGYSISNNLLLT
ncbi:hypothetical protein E2C01_088225 [Portunus trituberculatus]|uniref:Uncharacterized protein n=1 Tax=Portunus trituberculatus TaxID=210409 RepID=A0A5B7JET5_PORTR|nr:hypothetical protein [Portunus trituberculatus]